MRRCLAIAALLGCFAGPQATTAQEMKPWREAVDPSGVMTPRMPTHTYSIVARDPATGQLGVAVQSHWFSVGARVAWAEAGVGAVATQSFTNPSYGPLGLELMRAGKSADQALSALVSVDEGEAVRQVGMVDASGATATHTGGNAIIHACDHAGEGFTVHANLMDKPTVCDAMVDAYTGTQGDLAERLMSALEAAQAEGGDIRGKQSAAMIVVEGARADVSWGGRIYDLRVEDHATPIREMRRLLTLARAYGKMNEGDDHLAAGDVAAALAAYRSASEMAPDNHEMIFWHAATLVDLGRFDEARPLFARAFAMHPKWRELVPRLPKSGLMPDDPQLIERIVSIEAAEGY